MLCLLCNKEISGGPCVYEKDAIFVILCTKKDYDHESLKVGEKFLHNAGFKEATLCNECQETI